MPCRPQQQGTCSFSTLLSRVVGGSGYKLVGLLLTLQAKSQPILQPRSADIVGAAGLSAEVALGTSMLTMTVSTFIVGMLLVLVGECMQGCGMANGQMLRRRLRAGKEAGHSHIPLCPNLS